MWWDSGLKSRSTLEAWLQLQYCFNFKLLMTPGGVLQIKGSEQMKGEG